MDADAFFPFEFHLSGTPVSQQGSGASKERWKAEVGAAARLRIIETIEWAYLDLRPLSLTIFYFPIAAMGGDIDNIVKPIMDALIGIVYPDDRVVERVVVQKFEPADAWEFSQPEENLTAAISMRSSSAEPTPVVYVHVASDLGWRSL